MNILFVTIAWPSPGEKNLYSDLMDEFVRKGHKVYVVGAQDLDGNQKYFRTVDNGIDVLRINTGKIRKAAYIRKALTLITLSRKMLKGIKTNFRNVKFDLIISSTPPITLSVLFCKVKKSNSASFYLLLKDIWPQGSVDLNVFRKYSPIWFFLRYHEIRTYKIADYIGTMSFMNVEYLLNNNKYLSKFKVEVCPNSIRPSKNSFKSNAGTIRQKYGIPDDACVFIFSGNLGKGHGLYFLVDAIKHLSEYNKAYFVIGGSGTHLNYLKEAFKEHKANNVFIYKWLPKVDFDLLLNTSDVGLILLDKKFSIPQFPSRLLSYLDTGKPILCAVNNSTDIGTIVEKSSSGISITHGDLNAFISEVIYFSENKNERLQMGENARRLLTDYYTVDRSYKTIMAHFKK